MALLSTKISTEKINRIDEIVIKYNFRSRYKLLKYLVECFLKVADPIDDEFIPAEIEEMFDGYSELSRDDYQTTKKGVSI